MSEKASREFKRKRSKKFYMQSSKRKKRNFVLEPGMKGFIVTCNNREKECIREAYDLLNEFADKLYGSEKKSNVGDDDDIETALKNEVNSLKSTTERRFQIVDSNANNCLFVKTQVDDPCKLVYSILDDIETKKTQKTKYLLRMMPVMMTCKAYIEDIKKCVDTLATQFFSEAGNAYPTYAITYKIRNNNNVKREDLLLPLVELIQSKKLKTVPDLKNPSVVINIEIICTICCLSIVKDYYKYKKYNLVEFATKMKNDATNDCVENEVIDKKSEDNTDTEILDSEKDAIKNDDQEIIQKTSDLNSNQTEENKKVENTTEGK